MEFKGSQTHANLAKAFAGESQARNRYTYFASVAKKEGFNHISDIFIETAENERAHAKVFYDHLVSGLGEGIIEVNATYPVELADTAANLKAAAAGEREEWEVLYSNFAEVAEKEGFAEIANSFRQIAKVEKEHEDRYMALHELVKAGKYFQREEVKTWKCLNCGFIYEGNNALNICPACKHPQAHFEVYSREQ